MGFQRRESSVPGEGSFPACQHSSALLGDGDGAPSGGPEAHFHSSRIQPPLCWPGLPRAAAAAGEQSPIHPRGGFLPAARGRRWAGPRTPSCRPRRAARTGAHRARFRRLLWPGRPGRLSQRAPQWGSGETRFHFWAGDLRTLSLFSEEILSLLTARRERRCPFPPPSPAPPPLLVGMVRSKVLRAVRGLCFPSGASEIPTKGSLPDFCVSSVQCLESSYPLVATQYAITSLLRNFFFPGLKLNSSRLKFGTVASQQNHCFSSPVSLLGKRRKRTSSPPR